MSADDVTRLSGKGESDVAPGEETRLSPRTPSSESGKPSSKSASGWLSSSDAIDHGRFPPGTLLGNRYRIVGRVGRGGMGEVYRADDLKLGQPVALKFLAPEVDHDPVRLTQLHTEVRIAREISHPNVCRVYDIDEVDGHTFLSMEYVDGEDLASLLRRIGRFPQDRALDIGRQICAGLAAAHERGVVHRDLKPANVMLDGSGKVRVTDFGLAGAAGEALRAGTPAYMAPEQHAGGEVTVKSDIYALGLVLYEIFTGQRALEGRSLAELIHKREQAGLVPPTAIVRDLDPAIERTILRCLRPNPQERPSSALAVAASLPGGDPLAAALAAGETPSPEMVAAAGGTDVAPFGITIAAAAWIAFSLLIVLVLYQRVSLLNRVPVSKTPDALQDRAIDALGKLGYDLPSANFSARGLTYSYGYLRHLRAINQGSDRWREIETARPPILAFWLRTSPRPLIPFGTENRVSEENPPMAAAGMTRMFIDGSGRVFHFSAVPPVRRRPEPKTVDWSRVFEVTGLSEASFTPVSPLRLPPVFADARAAWQGHVPERPEQVVTLEAAAYEGTPVWISVGWPWDQPVPTEVPRRSRFEVAMETVAALVMPSLMVAAALLARRNVRLERGDRRSAFRAAAFIFVCGVVGWVLRPHVSPASTDMARMFTAIGGALFDAALMWLTYLALEPYVRRYFPDSLIGWTRLTAGRWRDPRVGADVMIGVSAGLAMTLLFAAHNAIPPLAGRSEPMPFPSDPTLLLGTREVLAYLVTKISDAVRSALLGVVGVMALLMWLKRPWAAGIIATVIYTPVILAGMFTDGAPLLDTAIGAAIGIAFVGTILRFGLLATAAALATHFVLLRAPLTLRTSAWYADATFWIVVAVAVWGLGGCYLARHGASRRAAATI